MYARGHERSKKFGNLLTGEVFFCSGAVGVGEANAGRTTAGRTSAEMSAAVFASRDLCSAPARRRVCGGGGGLRFVESRHEAQWSTQYLAAWRTKARQKPEGHRGQTELSVEEEQHEEEQQLL